MPIPDVGDELAPRKEGVNVDALDELELLSAVMKRGMLPTEEGAMQIKCPAFSSPAVCSLMMLWHPATGDPLPVCNGPSVRRKQKFSLLAWETKEWHDSDSVHSNCPYHPRRINEPPEYYPEQPGKRKGSSSTRGWFSDG